MPMKERWFGALGAVRRSEWPFAVLMFTYVFLVIATFWVLKPLKKGLFIQYYDQAGLMIDTHHFAAAEAELLAKVLNMVVALAAVAVFTWLARTLRRERLTAVLMAFFVVADVTFAQLLRAAPLELLTELGLQSDMELMEQLDDHRAEVMRQFHAAVLRDPALQAEHSALIAQRGRHQANQWFSAALAKRVEFELADEADVLRRTGLVKRPQHGVRFPFDERLGAEFRRPFHEFDDQGRFGKIERFNEHVVAGLESATVLEQYVGQFFESWIAHKLHYLRRTKHAGVLRTQ